MPRQNLTFNTAYYPAFENVIDIIKNYITPNKEHKKVISHVP